MPDPTGVKQGREASGRFRKGASGNPRGRPKGLKNKTTQLCADLLAGDAREIMGKLVEQAKQGDGVALRLCVERLVPARGARDRAVAVTLPEVHAVSDLVEAAAAVIGHAAAGDITLSEAREFMTLLEAQRKQIETADLVVRIEALEGSGVLEPQAAGDVDPQAAARVRRLER